MSRHQFGMRALLDHAAAIQHQAAVGADHAGQPVGQDERRAARHQPVQGLLYEGFVLGIHRRERLVQDQDGRVAQQRAGDCHTLSLPAGKLQAAFADARVVAVGQRHDEVVDIGRPRRRAPARAWHRAGPGAGSRPACRGTA